MDARKSSVQWSQFAIRVAVRAVGATARSVPAVPPSTAARVRSVMTRGVRGIHSDSTEPSRPVLERAGLVRITETVPWAWERTPA